MTPRLLVIDDNRDGLTLLTRALLRDEPGVEVRWVDSPQDLDAALARETYSLVITDYHLRWTDGLSIVRRIKAGWPQLPIIMLTETGDEEVAVEAMKSGLDDYVVKTPPHVARLPVAIRAALTRAAERQASAELESRYRSLFDTLPIALYRATPKGRILYANPALARLLGVADPSALVGVDVADFCVDRAARRALLDPAPDEDVFRRVVELRRPDGTTLWAESTGRVIRASSGEVLHLDGILQDVSDRARAEQALRASEERVRELLENASDVIYSLDLQGRITAINPAGERLLGVPAGEAIGVEIWNLIAPVHRRAMREAFEQKLAGADQTTYEIEAARPDGAPLVLEVTSRLVYRDGQPVGIHGFARDVTPRRRAEEQVRFQARLLDAVGQAVTATDRRGRITYWNRQAEAIYGWSAAEVLGRMAVDLMPAPHARELAEDVRNRVFRGEMWSGEFPMRRRDGTEFPALVTTAPVTDDAGRVVGLIGVASDISPLKRAEAEIRRLNADLEQRVYDRTRALADRERELAEAKGLLEHLIAASPGVIFRGDLRTGALTYVSDNIEWMTGYPAASFVGSLESLWALVHPDDRPHIRERMAQAIAAREPAVELEYRFPHRDGAVRWFYLVARLEYDASGAPASIVGYALDITSRKETEEALRLAKREADAANQAKNEFLSRMSHELRTPLNAVLGFGQLLELDDLSEEQRASVGHIMRAGRHLLDLINEVLDISRIEAGQFAVSLEPVPLREVAREAADLIRPLAAELGVHVECRVAEDGHVLADRKRLGQVLLNLGSNAVKYNRAGGSVWITTAAAAEGRRRILVADTGPGIDPAMLPRLFRPFERLSTGPTAIEGTGLGLALSKRLVDAMGGAIGVDSRPGEGSTFWVELPVAAAPLARPGREARETLDAGGSDGRLTVLYVEDNLPNLELIRGVLAHRPAVRLISAMQGQLGLDLAREHRPGLILLDLHLPDLRGDEVLRRLRADPRTRGIPVVVISADVTPGQIDRMLGAGVVAYLTKPIDVRRLIELVDATAVVEAGRDA